MSLLADNGMASPHRFTLLAGGANNRVFEVACPTGRAVLKYYLQGGAGERDRLGAEFDFLEHVAPRLGGVVANPIARSSASTMGLLSFLEGRPVEQKDLTPERLHETLRFARGCNDMRDSAAHLVSGAEACFSVRTHIETLERRLVRLEAIPNRGPLHSDLHRYLATELRPTWAHVRTFVGHASGEDLDTQMPHRDRCISPSDFGYHNALVLTNGALGFYDFEYAGWDDPAKLVGDFFSQPRIPAPLSWFKEFSATLADALDASPGTRARIHLLLPLYRIKWCLIMLNEFLPSKARRRTFSGQTTDVESAMAAQLEHSRAALAKLVPGRDDIRVSSDDGDVIITKVSNG